MRERPINPFPGLRPFRMEEKYLFFGREEQTRELLQRLRTSRFLAVVGTSGSGKSSLVQAGLLPHLYGGAMQEAGFQWEVAVMRPGGDPLTRLAEALVATDLYDPNRESAVLETRATLSRSALGLVESVRQSDIEPGSNLLVVVDQFEELFRFRHSGGTQHTEEAEVFVKLLLRASQQSEVPIYITLTMRSDYLGDCAQFPGLAEAVNDGEYLIPRLSRHQRRRAIEGPVKVGGGTIAPRLLQMLLNDVGDNPDHLPVLQHALMRTWDAWEHDREAIEAIDLRHYHGVGGMEEALSRHADEVYHELPDEEHRQIAEKVFKALTERSTDNRGIRRPARLRKLCAIAATEEGKAKAIIEAYRKMGRTFLMPMEEVPLSAETVIDISHESLMRVWKRLDGWVEEESQSARIYGRLRETAELHAGGKAGLYHDPDLQIAQSWREHSAPNEAWGEQYGGHFGTAMAFLDQSEATVHAQEREQEAARQRELEQTRQLAEAQHKAARNFKRFALGMGFVALLALLAFGFGLGKQKEAQAAAEMARKAEDSAKRAESEAVRLRIDAESKEETTRGRLARSDVRIAEIALAQSGPAAADFANAYLVRSLEAVPDQPAVADRLFNTLAYMAPPVFGCPDLNFGNEHVMNWFGALDGSLVATRTDQGPLRVWKPGSAEPIHVAKMMGNWFTSTDLSPDGRWLLYGGGQPGELLDTHTWISVLELPTFTWVAHFSPAGDRYVIVTLSGAEVWETKTNGAKLSTIGAYTGIATWHPNGRLLTIGPSAIPAGIGNGGSGNLGPTIDLVDSLSGEIKESYEHREDQIAYVSFNPDGSQFLNSSVNGEILVWNTRDGKSGPELILTHGEGRLVQLYNDRVKLPHYAIGAFTPDGQKIFTASTGGQLRLWDANTGNLLDSASIEGIVAFSPAPLFSEDGRRVLFRLTDGRCHYGKFDSLFDRLPVFSPPRPATEGFAYLGHSGELQPLLLPLDRVISGCVHPDDSTILLGTADGQAALYDLQTGERTTPRLQHHGEVQALAFNRDGNRFATGSFGTVRVWNAADAQPVSNWIDVRHEAESTSRSPIQKMQFSADGNRLVVFNDAGISAWDVEAGSLIQGRNEALAAPWGEMSPNDDYLLLVTARGGLLSKIGAQEGISLAHGKDLQTMAYSPDGRWLATGAENGELRLWELAQLPEDSSTTWSVAPLSGGKDVSIHSVAFSDDGLWLAAGDAESEVAVWRVSAPEQGPLFRFTGDGMCTSVRFSPDGLYVLGVFQKGGQSFTRLWHRKTGALVSESLGIETSQATLGAFNAKGTRLILWPQRSQFAGVAGVASVWDVAISEGQTPPSWFAETVAAFSGRRLDEQSRLVDLPFAAREEATKYLGTLSEQSPARQFFQWVAEAPHQRRDSPFRPAASAAYIDELSQQTEAVLVEEALRLRSRDPKLLARRAAARLVGASQIAPGDAIRSRGDLLLAEQLAPADAEVAWCRQLVLNRLGDKTLTWEPKRLQESMETLNLGQLIRILELHEGLGLPIADRAELVNRAIDLTRAGDDLLGQNAAFRLLRMRFEAAAGDGDFALVQSGWEAMKEANVDTRGLLRIYLDAMHSEAERLFAGGELEAALPLMQKVAVIAFCNREFDLDSKIRWMEQWSEWKLGKANATSFVPKGATWKYLDDGMKLDGAWNEPDYNEQPWEEGPGPLGYGEVYVATLLDYGPDGARKRMAAYFRHAFEAREWDPYALLGFQINFDDGLILYLNGEEILRDNMPFGEVTASTGALNEKPEIRGRTYGSYVISPTMLRRGKNVLAAEVHQNREGSSDLVFDLELNLISRERLVSGFADMLTAAPSRVLEELAASLPGEIGEEWLADARFLLLDQSENTQPVLPEETWDWAFTLLRDFQWLDRARTLIERRLQSLSMDGNQAEQALHQKWLFRKVTLRGDQRYEGRDEDLATLRAVPQRDPACDAKQLDLTEFYTVSLYYPSEGGLYPRRGGLDTLALTYESDRPGAQPFDFRGAIYLNSGPDSVGRNWSGLESLGEEMKKNALNQEVSTPYEVRGIPVGQNASAVHVFHAGLAANQRASVEKPLVATYRIHYKDGSTQDILANFNEGIFDIYLPMTDLEDPVVWKGRGLGNTSHFTVLSWKNPRPEEEITSIDLISAKNPAAGVVIIGITLE